jgi:hypothetical protein
VPHADCLHPGEGGDQLGQLPQVAGAPHLQQDSARQRSATAEPTTRWCRPEPLRFGPWLTAASSHLDLPAAAVLALHVHTRGWREERAQRMHRRACGLGMSGLLPLLPAWRVQAALPGSWSGLVAAHSLGGQPWGPCDRWRPGQPRGTPQ